jgi:hypothetical protein
MPHYSTIPSVRLLVFCFISVYQARLSHLTAVAFRELWHFLRSNDLHEMHFEECPANGLPTRLILSGRQYIDSIHNPRLLISLLAVYDKEGRDLMKLFVQDRLLELRTMSESGNPVHPSMTIAQAVTSPSLIVTRSGGPPDIFPW